jgi:hypothetical protein
LKRIEIGTIFLEGNLAMSNKFTRHLPIDLAIVRAEKNLDKLVKV